MLWSFDISNLKIVYIFASTRLNFEFRKFVIQRGKMPRRIYVLGKRDVSLPLNMTNSSLVCLKKRNSTFDLIIPYSLRSFALVEVI